MPDDDYKFPHETEDDNTSSEIDIDIEAYDEEKHKYEDYDILQEQVEEKMKDLEAEDFPIEW